MKKIKKIGCLLVTLMLLATTLMGCTGEQDDLYKAYFAKYESGKMNMKMAVKFNKPLPTDLDPDGTIAALINKASVDVNATYQSKDFKNIKMAMDMKFNGLDPAVMPMPNLNAWVDVSIADNALAGKVIYEYPADMTKAMIQGTNAPETVKYLYIDYANEMFAQLLPTELMNMTEEQQVDMTKEMIKQVSDLGVKPEFKDGVYTITINKEQMKKVFASLMDYSMKVNESTLNEMKKSMTKEELATFEASYAEGMKIINQLDLFADNAAIIKITLDENKLMKTMDTAINFNIDIEKAMATLMGSVEEKTTPVVNNVIDMTFNMNITYSDTNKPVEVKMPTLTKENSVDMMAMLTEVPADKTATEKIEAPAEKIEAPAGKEAPKADTVKDVPTDKEAPVK